MKNSIVTSVSLFRHIDSTMGITFPDKTQVTISIPFQGDQVATESKLRAIARTIDESIGNDCAATPVEHIAHEMD